VLQRAPLDPDAAALQVYREPFAVSFRRPSRSILSRFLAHLLIRLLIVSALPTQWQAASALFPVSMLWPLVVPASDEAPPPAAASACGPETRVWGFEQEIGPRVGAEAAQAAESRRGYEVGYDGSASDRLFNAKARFYDPTVGRFTTQDNVLGQIDDPPSLHRYFYANDNPTRYLDTTGHTGVSAKDALHYSVSAVYAFAYDIAPGAETMAKLRVIGTPEDVAEALGSDASFSGAETGHHAAKVVGIVETGAGAVAIAGALAGGGGSIGVGFIPGGQALTAVGVPAAVVVGAVGVGVGGVGVVTTMKASRGMDRIQDRKAQVLRENTPTKENQAPTKAEPATGSPGEPDPPGTVRDANGKLRDASGKRVGVANPEGSKGAADHQKATKELTKDFQARYPAEEGYEVRSNQSIEKETSLKRKPDAAAVKDNKVVEVGEVARTNADNQTLVSRERLKQQQYQDKGIQSKVVRLPKRPQAAPNPSAPPAPPTVKPEE
jgi:RHS repeat-associated protein